MENIIVTATNLYAIRAITQCYKNGSSINGVMVFLPMTASILYHLSEHSKHYMPGAYLHKYELSLLNFDRFAAIISGIYFGMKYHSAINNKNVLMLSLMTTTVGFVSEMVTRYTNTSEKIKYAMEKTIGIESTPSVEFIHKMLYMISHSLWHVGVFHITYLLTSKK